MPLTVMGEVVNDAPLPGVVIDAPCLGAGCIFVASNPNEPGFGSGTGSGVKADAGCTATNISSRQTPIIIENIHRALKYMVAVMLVLSVAWVYRIQKGLSLFSA